MLKLSCVNCGAPLEIGADLATFACGYCGTQQQVERKGGIVALRRVEAAIQQVQRGTDRTAAELALARLAKEIAEAEAGRNAAVQLAWKNDGNARRDRIIVSLLVAVVSLSVFLILAKPLLNMEGTWHGLGIFMAFLASFIATAWVFRRIRIPEEPVRRITDHWDPIINGLKSQVAANRAVLDKRTKSE